MDRIRQKSDRTFLIQTKNPRTLKRVVIPENVIVGITLETNNDEIYPGFSKAPIPSQRYRDFLDLNHPTKMITIEPVIQFHLDTMIRWVTSIQPNIVWIGYDSMRDDLLPEPELSTVLALSTAIEDNGITVLHKTMRAKGHGSTSI